MSGHGMKLPANLSTASFCSISLLRFGGNMYQVKCPHCSKTFDIAMPKQTKASKERKKIDIDNKKFFGGMLVILLVLWLLG